MLATPSRAPAGEPRANGATAAAPALSGLPPPPPRAPGVPVYCMLPLDTVDTGGAFRYAKSAWFEAALASLASAGVHGVAVDVWWGGVERAPRSYDFSGVADLVAAAARAGLRVQAVLSFHACVGGRGERGGEMERGERGAATTRPLPPLPRLSTAAAATWATTPPSRCPPGSPRPPRATPTSSTATRRAAARSAPATRKPCRSSRTGTRGRWGAGGLSSATASSWLPLGPPLNPSWAPGSTRSSSARGRAAS